MKLAAFDDELYLLLILNIFRLKVGCVSSFVHLRDSKQVFDVFTTSHDKKAVVNKHY